MQESDKGIMSLKPPSADDSQFQPVFRSGSCSEKGPKSYMEDEYICVDNLNEHLGSASSLSTSGAFYGVCHLAIGLATLIISWIYWSVETMIMTLLHFDSEIFYGRLIISAQGS